eukprot:TRINITY_DN51198_c0_g1_i1.p1 TRINITY_DN51198_c0_g1~~TRINITY_DN51198_c0_g1_i1.p1  ORF type:complete len:469 (+),score=112.71 TRINITY_DN51198_c0_g1_i1:57-1463(+)
MAPKALFKGQIFALSGKLSQPRKDYEETIRKHGGGLASSVTAAVTYLVSNEADVKALPQKVATAVGRGTPIVQEGFIGACIAADKLLSAEFFAVKGVKKRSTPAVRKTCAKKAKKETAAIGAVMRAPPESFPVFARAGLANTVAVVQEEISKGFMKATLTWSVELLLTDPAKARDRFYNMQLLASKACDEFWTVQHFGRTGMEGRVDLNGPFSNMSDAKTIFRRKYRQKTGNVWGQLGASVAESEGKYKLLAVREEKETKVPGKWQYYLHNEVNGKAIGWYDYEGESAENMEKYWDQFTNNDGLEKRFVQTSHFKYEVNFSDMIQTNLKSGTRRVIRRVRSDEKPSPKPPSKIPVPIKPAPPEAEDSGDEEEEDEAEDDGEDEEEEDGVGDEDGMEIADGAADEAPLAARAPPTETIPMAVGRSASACGSGEQRTAASPPRCSIAETVVGEAPMRTPPPARGEVPLAD